MFAEAIEEILADRFTPAAIRVVEAGGSPTALWSTLAESGFLELLAPEDAGGASLALNDLFPIIASFGRHALPVPAAQSIAARALLLPHDVAVPPGMGTLASSCGLADDGSVECTLTPFGAMADFVLADQGGDLVLLSCAQAERVAPGVHGSLSATLRWRAMNPDARIAGAGGDIAVFGAALHAALLAGAMGRVFDMTLQYGNDRSQFGKSIGKFQAIQHQLSVMAEHVAAAGIAAELAFSGAGPLPARLPTAIAKARTSEAVAVVAAIAHAVHGAIGVTEEYDLQLFTRRMHEWRIAHGSEAYWNVVVGEALLARKDETITDFVRAAIDAANIPRVPSARSENSPTAPSPRFRR